MQIKIAFVLFSAASLWAAREAAALDYYEGEAYAAATRSLLYRESHWRDDKDGAQEDLVLYRCPDGLPFARKRLRSGAMTQMPTFDFIDARNGYAEGVREKGLSREVFVRVKSGMPERSASLENRADLVVDAGFDAFVREHWDALGTTAVPLSFLVPSRLGALDFQVRRIGEEVVGDPSETRFRLSLARWYGAFLPRIDVAYDTQTHRLIRYEGISNIRDAAERNVTVRIEFRESARHDAVSAEDVTAAAAAPLIGKCPLS